MARLFNEQEFEDSFNENDLLNIVGGGTTLTPTPTLTPTVAPTPDYSGILTGYYQDILGRAPDQGGFDFWMNALQSGNYTPEFVKQQFLSSPEYLARQTPTPAPTPTAAAPFNFRDYMYAGGADDTLATQRGLQYAAQQGWTPGQTVSEWNQALGTNFTLDDYYRVTGTTPPAPTVPTTPAPTPTTAILTDTSDQTLTADDLGVSPTPTPTIPTPTPTTPAATPVAGPVDTWGKEYEAQPIGDGTYTSSQIPNITLPPGFNWQDYVNKNPDLKQAGIDTQAEAERHYRLYGVNENRQGVPATSLQDLIGIAKKDITNQNAFVDAGEAGPQAVGKQVGQYSITPTGYGTVEGFDIAGFSGKTGSALPFAPAGTPFDQVIRTDKDGNIIGYQMNLKTGGDSGYYVDVDANGNITSVQNYDESESWRKPAAMFATLIGASVGVPQLGAWLSGGALAAGSAGAAALGGAALGAANAAIAGAEGADILRAATVGAAAAGAGQFAGQYANQAVNNLGLTGTCYYGSRHRCSVCIATGNCNR
jgi:hypothetical protein